MKLNANALCPLLAVAGLLATSCASGELGPGEPAPIAIEQPRRAPVRIAAPSNAAYVATAASIDLFEIQTAELARHRSSRAATREFAAMMIAAHRGTSAQLSLAGRRLNLLPSAKLNARHQRMLQELSSTPNFDAAYRRQQATVHQEAFSLHSNYAASGSSPTLRPVAIRMKPIIERHMRMLRHL